MSVYAQHGYAVRFDWGLRGAEECAPGSSVVAVVDVLSFTTATTVAVEHGIDVLPYRWRDESAIAYAVENQAELAVGRSQAGPGQISLSPVTLQAAQGIRRVVLPSPNGSTISQYVAGLGSVVVAVSLRNASAAARWVRAQEGVVTVIAGGEKWPGGELRPAVEDLWGAGAFLAALEADGLSPEASAAVGAFEAVDDVREALLGSASGRELVALGYQQDVELAAGYDATQVVPVLRDGRFTDMAKALPE
ncbi:2-phosphosulfolactate phosphatase [Kribbella deserti]|uniref:Probable 2-phosphosulfolactate phosphatase n=1 Tax=Kribbella deserti TaxID=1926257 RepID=A0ABV6QYC7_9ACTN